MKKEWVQAYIDQVNQDEGDTGFDVVQLSGSSSCTQNLAIALEFAFKQKMIGFVAAEPVLFVTTCQNFEGFSGFRLNHMGYTAYPYEQEVLLSEGCQVYVLDVVSGFLVENADPSFRAYDQKKLTIIHLFMPDATKANEFGAHRSSKA